MKWIIFLFPALLLSQSTLVSDGYNQPLTTVFTEEYILVGEKNGKVFVGDLSGDFYNKREEPILDLDTATGGERGLLDLKLQSNWLYVFYTHSSEEFDRLEIYQLDIQNNVSDLVLWIIDIPAYSWNHHGGTIEFHSDGDVLLTTGDGSDEPDETGLGGKYRSQTNSLNGKVLKIDQVTKEYEILARGLRNPFRAHSYQDELYIADVGWASWEEINVLSNNPTNYGWGFFEGNEQTNLPIVINPETNQEFVLSNTIPLIAYGHGNDIEINGSHDPESFNPLGNAITGIAVNENGIYFLDYLQTWIALYDGEKVINVGDTGFNFITHLTIWKDELYFTRSTGVYKFEPETLSVEQFSFDGIKPTYLDMLGKPIEKDYASDGIYIAEYRKGNKVKRKLEIIKN